MNLKEKTNGKDFQTKTKNKRIRKDDPLNPSNDPKEILKYLKTQLTPLEDYNKNYKQIENFNSSKMCDLEETKKYILNGKA
jgi:hypothetical protein